MKLAISSADNEEATARGRQKEREITREGETARQTDVAKAKAKV